MTRMLANLKEPILPGDVIELYRSDLEKIFYNNTFPRPEPQGKTKVRCHVLRAYIKSHYEIRYVCISSHPKFIKEFVLSTFTEDLFQINPELKLPADILRQARERCNAHPINDNYPFLYTKEDIAKLAAEIKNIQKESL